MHGLCFYIEHLFLIQFFVTRQIIYSPLSPQSRIPSLPFYLLFLCFVFIIKRVFSSVFASFWYIFAELNVKREIKRDYASTGCVKSLSYNSPDTSNQCMLYGSTIGEFPGLIFKREMLFFDVTLSFLSVQYCIFLLKVRILKFNITFFCSKDKQDILS